MNPEWTTELAKDHEPMRDGLEVYAQNIEALRDKQRARDMAAIYEIYGLDLSVIDRLSDAAIQAMMAPQRKFSEANQ